MVLLWAWHYSQSTVYVNTLNSHSDPMMRTLLLSHFSEEETELVRC